MGKITEKQIAQQITELINYNVNKLKNNDEIYKNQFNDVMFEIESEIKSTEETIEDFSESKLTINKIEQEGYLRCLKTMYNRFNSFNSFK